MPFHTACSSCGADYHLADAARGQKVRCKHCRQVFEVVPATEETVPEVLAATPNGLQKEPGGPPRRPGMESTSASPPAVKKSGFPVVLVVLLGLGVLGMCVLCGGGGLVALWIVPSKSAQVDNSQTSNQAAAPREPDELGAIVPPPKEPGLRPRPQPQPQPQPQPGPGVVPDPQKPPAEPPFAGPVIHINQPLFAHQGIKPPDLPEEQVSKPLPGPVSEVAVGGGGRFLILHVPSQNQLAVFDVNQASFVKTLPLADRDARFTAGMDHLLIASPAAKTLERWSLLNFRREHSVPLTLHGKLHALAMGSASNGPLLVASGRSGEFFHVATLEPYPLHWKAPQRMPAIDSPFVRASSDGRLFCFREGAGGEPHVDRIITLNGQEASALQAWNISPSVLLPANDDRVIYSGYGMFTPELKPIPFKDEEPAGQPGRPRPPIPQVTSFLPAHHGPFFVQLRPAPWGTVEEKRGLGDLAFRLPGQDRPFARLEKIGGITPENIAYGKLNGSLCHDRRIHFVPAAKLLISIPTTNDRLVLHRFDADAALEKSGLGYLFVTTRPPSSVARGAEYSYQIGTKSKKGGVQYKLLSGPDGLTVSPDGLVNWSVPAKLDEPHAAVTVKITDGGGQEVLHSFTILCR